MLMCFHVCKIYLVTEVQVLKFCGTCMASFYVTNFQSSVLTGQLTPLHTLSLFPPPLSPTSGQLTALHALSLSLSPLFPLPSLLGTEPFLIINNYLANWEILFGESTDHSCLFLFWARWIHSTISHSISLRFVWIVPCHLCLGLLSVPLPSDFPNKVYMHICYLSVLHNLTISLCLILNFPTITGDLYKLWSSARIIFSFVLLLPTPLGPSVLLSTQLSVKLSMCNSLNVREHASCKMRQQYFTSVYFSVCVFK